MQITITLEIDRALLQKAQAWADQQQITLSEAIANLLQKLPDPEPQIPQPSLATAFAELQKICQAENYVLETPARSDRPNPFIQN
jgi:antitoxin component of RelBE/YafQ-DinJ toxin-antitoxin module